MSDLPLDLYTAEQVRALDRYAMERGVPGYTLMCRAGAAALAVLRDAWPQARRVTVLCGGGNNGGDGYVLARLARVAGLEVDVQALKDPSGLTGDARLAREECLAAGVPIGAFAPARLSAAEVLVDAIFGTGLDRSVAEPMVAQIEAINASGRPVLALDLPSGLNADTGAVMGVAVRADHTVSFVGLKLGCFTADGPDCAGRVHFADLEVTAPLAAPTPAARRLDPALLAQALPARARSAHKGRFGRVLIVGGGPGMAGAARLCGEACLRAGAGLVTLAVHEANVSAVVAGRPELICHGVREAQALEPLLAAADVVAVGPGLGTDNWARSMFARARLTDKPTVFDADALNLLARERRRKGSFERVVLTPHPGEAARLLESDAASVQRARPASLQRLLQAYGGIVVLKGAGTLIGQAGCTPALCDRGNPGMATAGMGDVLTGVLAALLAQLPDPWEAVCAAVFAHALAGDAAACAGERGLIASDVIAQLPACLNPASN